MNRNSRDIQELKDRINTMQGRGAGLDEGWVKLLGAFGLISSIVAFIATR